MTTDAYPWMLLDEHVPALFDDLDRATERLSKDTGRLAQAAAGQVRAHRADEWICRNRLFGVAVLGSQGEDPRLALPVAVTSLLWWAGAEALDDLADGYGSGGLNGAKLHRHTTPTRRRACSRSGRQRRPTSSPRALHDQRKAWRRQAGALQPIEKAELAIARVSMI